MSFSPQSRRGRKDNDFWLTDFTDRMNLCSYVKSESAFFKQKIKSDYSF